MLTLLGNGRAKFLVTDFESGIDLLNKQINKQAGKQTKK